MGVFVSLDLFMFFVFFEIVLIPMYFLIGKWGHGNAQYAATKFFLYTMFGSALMLVSIVSLAVLHAQNSDSELTFNLIEIATNPAIATNTSRLIFLGFAIAFAVKSHYSGPYMATRRSHRSSNCRLSHTRRSHVKTWNIRLYPVRPLPVPRSFPLLRTPIPNPGSDRNRLRCNSCNHAKDLKRLVAYSSIAHLGFIILGTFALNTQGIQGATVQMINHGLSTGALFMLVGIIYERKHTRQISELSGIQKSAPVLAGVFTLVMLSSIGLPGLNGFVGEFLILLGTFTANRWWAVIAATGVILAALYLLWAYQRVFHGPQNLEDEPTKDLTNWERLTLLPLIVAIVFLGIYPKPMLDRIEPAVDKLVTHIEATIEDGSFTEPVPTTQNRTSFSDLLKQTHESHSYHKHDGHHDHESDHKDGSHSGDHE